MTKKMTPKTKASASAMTPMNLVKNVYPTAKAVKVDNGWYIANFVGSDRYSLSDVRTSANAAWMDATKSLSPVEIGKKKLSKRRQRIIHKIETGEYTQKTPERSLNIAFRCYRQ